MLTFVLTVFVWFVSGCTLYVSASQSIEFNYAESELDCKPGYCNYKITPGNTKEDTVICIYRSYEFQNQHDIKQILKYIINTEKGKECNLSEDDIPYYVAEWVAHNFAYTYPTMASSLLDTPVETIIIKSRHSELNLNDAYADIYWMYYNSLYK